MGKAADLSNFHKVKTLWLVDWISITKTVPECLVCCSYAVGRDHVLGGQDSGEMCVTQGKLIPGENGDY